MKDQQTKIRGYRDLTKEEIDLMNNIKDLEAQVANLCNNLGSSVHDCEPTNDLNEARAKLQIGFMLLVRSVAKPISPWGGDYA